MKEDQLLTKLREAFKVEAEERLNTISSSLVELEKLASEPDKQKPIIEVVFREAHSLKGASRAVNLVEIETLCQSMEGVFSALKDNGVPLTPELFDKLHYTVEIIEDFLMDAENEQTASFQEEIPKIVKQMQHMISGNGNDGNNEKAKTSERAAGESDRKSQETQAESVAPLEETDKSQAEEEVTERVDEEAEAQADQPSEKAPRPSLSDGKDLKNAAQTSPRQEDKPDAQSKIEEQDQIPRGSQGNQNRPLISGTVRISTEKLDTLMLKAEELILLKLAESQHLMNLQDTMQTFEFWKKKWAKIEAELRFLSRYMQTGLVKEQGHLSLTEFASLLDWNQEQIQDLERKIRTLVKASEHNHHSLGRMVDDLLDDMKMVTMLPFSTLFNLLPRMVRDLSRNQGKEVDLKLQGEDIEIDRRILEEMKDPIIHLLRNAIDHGIEDPEKRKELKKTKYGTINLSINQAEGDKVEILFSDDGHGIDFEHVKEEAIARGVISRKEAKNLEDQDVILLIFRSGITTSPMITEISGRGLGMSIVQEKVEQLGGSLSVETQLGKGTSFRILLPVTMATFKGILIQVSGDLFVVPTSHVDRVLRIKKVEVKTVEGNTTIPLNGKTLALVELGDILELHRKEKKDDDEEYITVLILGSEDKQIAFKIDEVLTEQEVLVKSMGKQLSRVRNIAGATVLGSGEVVPILNAQDLLKSAIKAKMISAKAIVAEEEIDTRKKSVLVVEDSITSRMLIKNILESSGYYVKTASDGLDGFNTLKAGDFDLVVSDVEMPSMSGFELTAKIRADKRVSQTPVILCTSLASREDRERGVEVGANAYIVKSSFDQSNLLEVVKKLI